MAKWIEYTGSDEQIEEILRNKDGFSYIRNMNDNDIKVYMSPLTKKYLVALLSDCDRYLINNTHPYADIIKIWADTGCEVWVRQLIRNYTFPDYLTNKYDVIVTDKPDWNIPNAEYKLTPFEVDHER